MAFKLCRLPKLISAPLQTNSSRFFLSSKIGRTSQLRLQGVVLQPAFETLREGQAELFATLDHATLQSKNSAPRSAHWFWQNRDCAGTYATSNAERYL